MAKEYLKHYQYGQKKIQSLAPDLEGETWRYSLQLHQNQNGKHWDFRLHRPSEQHAYSWAMKKIPFGNVKPILATRTHDHETKHMTFEGPMTTAKGYGSVKLVSHGDVRVKKIDKNGIQFQLGKASYRLRPYKDRRYLFESVFYE